LGNQVRRKKKNPHKTRNLNGGKRETELPLEYTILWQYNVKNVNVSPEE
jgi:hypothetical protein